jgi:outer membrane protein insertion porin family
VLEEQQQAVNERTQAILQKAQSRLSELVCAIYEPGLSQGSQTPLIGPAELPANLDCYQLDQNSTLPCAISSVQVVSAPHTRRSFLERIVNPLLSENKDRPYTLSEALREVSATADKLGRFGSWHRRYRDMTHDILTSIQTSSSSPSPFTWISRKRTPATDCAKST